MSSAAEKKNPGKFQCFICAKNIRLQPSEKKNRLRRFVLRFYAILVSKIFQHQHTPRPTMFFFLFVGFVYIENFVPSPHLIVRLREKIRPSCGRKRWWHSTVTRAAPQRRVGPKILRFRPSIQEFFGNFWFQLFFPSTHNFSPPSFGCYQLLKNKKKRNTTIPSKRVLRNPPVTSPQQTNLKQKNSMHYRDLKRIKDLQQNFFQQPFFTNKPTKNRGTKFPLNSALKITLPLRSSPQSLSDVDPTGWLGLLTRNFTKHFDTRKLTQPPGVGWYGWYLKATAGWYRSDGKWL